VPERVGAFIAVRRSVGCAADAEGIENDEDCARHVSISPVGHVIRKSSITLSKHSCVKSTP
jgi:hypothetical protein